MSERKVVEVKKTGGTVVDGERLAGMFRVSVPFKIIGATVGRLFSSSDRCELVGYYAKDFASGEISLEELLNRLKPEEALAVVVGAAANDVELGQYFGEAIMAALRVLLSASTDDVVGAHPSNKVIRKRVGSKMLEDAVDAVVAGAVVVDQDAKMSALLQSEQVADDFTDDAGLKDPSHEVLDDGDLAIEDDVGDDADLSFPLSDEDDGDQGLRLDEDVSDTKGSFRVEDTDGVDEGATEGRRYSIDEIFGN